MILNLFSKRVEEVRNGDNIVIKFITGEDVKYTKVKSISFKPFGSTIYLEDGTEIEFNSSSMVLVCEDGDN